MASAPDADPTALARLQREAVLWQNRTLPLPTTLESLWTASGEQPATTLQADRMDETSTPRWSHLRQGLRWSNVGLAFSQSQAERCSNAQLAQVFNRLAANGLGPEPFRFEGCRDGASLLAWFAGQGWRVCARLRCSVASFGFGASLALEGQPVRQIPLALPMRTGLLNDRGQEVLSLLPHTALELELSDGRRSLRLQWFQGTTGLCGWDALNDLHRPWQNDRQNGTVRYLGEPFSPDQWSTLLHMTELIALVHNLEATDQHLRLGGYGSLGFCIDSTALLQQALCGCCDLFPWCCRVCGVSGWISAVCRWCVLLRCLQALQRSARPIARPCRHFRSIFHITALRSLTPGGACGHRCHCKVRLP